MGATYEIHDLNKGRRARGLQFSNSNARTYSEACERLAVADSARLFLSAASR